MEFQRAAGVLLPVSALPGKYGVGTLGKDARRFVDFLADAGGRWWQVLPLCPSGPGESPYQSPSAFAGDPLFIDPDWLAEHGYITPEERAASELTDADPRRADYLRAKQKRAALLRLALPRFTADPPADFADFCAREADWLDDHALFMAVRAAYNGAPFSTWEDGIRQHTAAAVREWSERGEREVRLHRMLQYLFYTQWRELKDYANSRGVRILGDLPIYVAMNSADVWAESHIFALDPDGQPVEVAGCPPDGFSADGQLWGNPVYDWNALRLGGYRWWVRRLRAALTLYDAVRIDHFRGFSAYYCIPAGAETAREGVWRSGPGMDLWNAVKNQLGDVPIIAEDLGYLTPEVYQLLKDSGFPGMKVLQFAFGGGTDNDHLPHRYTKNSVAYTGTHDNDTLRGFVDTAAPETLAMAKKYLRVPDTADLPRAMMAAAMASVSDLCILPMQDLLGLGAEARMNTPSTVGGNNWCWRLQAGELTPEAAREFREMTEIYGR